LRRAKPVRLPQVNGKDVVQVAEAAEEERQRSIA
jgi:hypothetical protein